MVPTHPLNSPIYMPVAGVVAHVDQHPGLRPARVPLKTQGLIQTTEHVLRRIGIRDRADPVDESMEATLHAIGVGIGSWKMGRNEEVGM